MTKLLVFLIALFATLPAQAGGPSERAEPRDGAQAVYGRLVAPCCWNQTLDVHDSELATALRVEVATRLRAGEAALLIEDDLAQRYGERIRAVPRGIDTRSYVGVSVFATLTVLLIALFIIAQRWVRRGRLDADQARAATLVGETSDDRYDEALDRELEHNRERR